MQKLWLSRNQPHEGNAKAIVTQWQELTVLEYFVASLREQTDEWPAGRGAVESRLQFDI